MFELPFDYVLGVAAWIAALAAMFFGLLWLRRRLHLRGLRVVWASAGLSIWLLLVLLTAIELFFAIAYDQSDALNATNVSKIWFERHVAPEQKALQFADGQGTIYRDDREFPKRLAEGQKHICFIGDSFTFGHGVPHVADRFSNRVGAELERLHRGKFVVSNLADAGRELHWGEALLKELIANRMPVDIVVYTICLNDIETFDERHTEYYASLGAEAPKSFLIRDTYFFNLLYYRLRQLRSPLLTRYYSLLEEWYAGPAAGRMCQKLADIHRLCRDNGIDFRVMIFPFLHNLGPDYPFGEAHEKIMACCRADKIPALDLKPVLLPHAGEGLIVNRFDPHPNERAHALAAEAILSELLKDVQAE